MPKPRKTTETVTDDVTLTPYQVARLSEHAAELSLRIGRVVSLDEYLVLVAMTVIRPQVIEGKRRSS